MFRLEIASFEKRPYFAEQAGLHHRVEAEKKRFVGSELAGKTLGVSVWVRSE